MPTPKQRTLSIRYGNYTVGGADTTRQITDYHEVRQGFTTAEVQFTFVVTASSASGLSSAVRLAEDAFRTPYQDLVIRNGSGALLDLRQSNATSLDAQPEIVKQGQVGDTGLSRYYTVRIVTGRPANVGVEFSGARTVNTSVAYSPSRRKTVLIDGTITAVGSRDSQGQYDAIIDAIVQSRLGFFAGTFELIREESEFDTNNRLLDFTRTYQEIISSQAGANLDDPDIVDQDVAINRLLVDSESSLPVDELVILQGEYNASIDAERTTDLEGKWEDDIKPWLISQLTGLVSGAQYGITRESPTFNYDANTISASITLTARGGSSKLISTRQVIADNVSGGTNLVAAWAGDPFGRYVYQGPAAYIRTFVEERLVFGRLSNAQAQAEVLTFSTDNRSGKYEVKPVGIPALWDETSQDVSVEYKRIGAGDEFMDASLISSTIKVEGYNQVGPTTGSGGGRPTTGNSDQPGSSDGATSSIGSTGQGVSPNA